MSLQSNKLYCPACQAEVEPGDPNHQSVSSVHAAQSGNYRDSDGWSTFGQSELGKQLAPPALGLDHTFNQFGCGVVMGLVTAVFLLGIGIHQIVNGNLVVGIIAIPIAPLVVWYSLRDRVVARRHARQMPLLKSLWSNSYYCKIHDRVFNKTLEVNVPARQFQDFMRGYWQ